MEPNTPVTVAMAKVLYGASKRLVTIDEVGKVTLIGSQTSFSYKHFFDVNVLISKTSTDDVDDEIIDSMICLVSAALESAKNADPKRDHIYIANRQSADIKERKSELFFLKSLKPLQNDFAV